MSLRNKFIFLALVGVASLTSAHRLSAEPFTIGEYQTVSETRLGRTLFRYVLRAKITNLGPGFTGVRATVASTSPKTTIVENELVFGVVAAASKVATNDTITIVHDRTLPFDPAALKWNFVADPISQTGGIGTAGGALGLPDGSNLTIPAGALASNAVVTLTRKLNPAAEADSFAEAGELIYEVESDTTALAVPGTLTVPVGQLPDPLAPYEVVFYEKNADQADWSPSASPLIDPNDEHPPLDGFPIDPVTGTVTLQLTDLGGGVGAAGAKTVGAGAAGKKKKIKKEKEITDFVTDGTR